MARRIQSLLALLVFGTALAAPGIVTAGGSVDDLFGDLANVQQQQSVGYDDSGFMQIMSQEFTDFRDVAKHKTPARSRIRTYPGPYRFVDTDFDVYWDTVSFRSKEAQDAGAALVTVMFKDVVHFDQGRSRTQFSLNALIGTALRDCSRTPQPATRYGKGSLPTANQDQNLYGKGEIVSKRESTSGDLNFDFPDPLNLGQQRQPWDERIGPGDGGFPGAYGDPFDKDPILSQDPLVFRSDKYVVGGYRGLYDFSRANGNLVKNFLVRAAQDSGFERLYSNAFMAPDEGTTYYQVKRHLTQKKLPVLTLLPRTKEAVLIYRVIERGDGLGAMMYWRPTDPVNQRVAREISQENVIWAVPNGSGGYQFVDRAELQNRRFRFGNHATVLIVPNLCTVYQIFAGYLQQTEVDPGYNPGKRKGTPYPDPWPQDQYPQDQYPYPQDQYPIPPRPNPPRPIPDYGPNPGFQDPFNWSVDLLFGGNTGISLGGSNGRNPGWQTPPFVPPQRPPPIQIDPPWDQGYPPPYVQPPYNQTPPTYYPPPPPPPPPPQYIYRPTPKNPYCNKPVGTGRGAFVKIGFGYDETGFNIYGFDTAGLDHTGFDPWGCDATGYYRDGFDPWGYDRGGYNRSGFSLINRAREFIDLVNQYHQGPFAFRMQFDITENGSIIRIVDGAMVWNNGAAGTTGGGVPIAPPPIIAPPIPGAPLQKADDTPEWRDVTITGKITGISQPYTVQLDRQNHYHIFKDSVRTAIPRNINVNADFQMTYQDKTKDYVFIQSTPATK